MEVGDILRDKDMYLCLCTWSGWRHIHSTFRIISVCDDGFETDTNDAFSNASRADPDCF